MFLALIIIREIMEECTKAEAKKESSIPIELESNKLDNNNENNKQNKSMLEDLNSIINNINRDFDFQTFEKEALNTIEKVIRFI